MTPAAERRFKMYALLMALLTAALIFSLWVALLTEGPRALAAQAALVARAEAGRADGIELQALQLLREAAAIETSETQAVQIKLAALLLELEREQAALTLLTQLIEEGTDRVEAYRLLTDCYLEKGRFSECIRVLKTGCLVTGDQELCEIYGQLRYLTHRIPGTFDAARRFTNGMAAVRINHVWGYINRRGRWVMEPQFTEAADCSGERLLVLRDNRVAAVDRQGFNEAVADVEASSLQSLGDGWAAACTAEGWVLLNADLETVGGPVTDISKYYDGRALVLSNQEWRVINSDGGTLTVLQEAVMILNERSECFRQGVNFAGYQGNLYLIDAAGVPVGSKHFDDAKGFLDGWAAVKLDGRWGFCDSSGEIQLAPRWEDARSFSCGIAAVKLDGRWGYIDEYGEMVIGNNFDDAHSFSEGLAAVCIQGAWSYLALYAHE